MKFNKIYNVLAATGVIFTVLTSTSALADDQDYTFGFSTVPDVTLTPVTDLNFGGQLGLSGGSQCTMTVGDGGTDTPGSINAKVGTASAEAIGANYAELTGVGCGAAAVGTDGIVGVYEIVGAPGVKVDVTLTSQLSGTNFNFVPNGVTVLHNDESDGDTLVALAAGSAATAQLATVDDLSGNTEGSGVPEIGKSLIFVGGTITVTSTLLAGTEYTETFGIDVVYQ
ncbi:hypothetical protein [Colwellia sp. C1TZA3]|uniref:hypothetical protein n=1 Tax=Colwellia sp. C1TZA3 TaxID=2508879 RepID=UPI0011BA05A1|nr:hypothetical protein [Colwellia sp. C1TZA3]TWX67479.1 hypothetical protein ESZ39_13380 [Colwellia sp. C1TZA3]